VMCQSLGSGQCAMGGERRVSHWAQHHQLSIRHALTLNFARIVPGYSSVHSACETLVPWGFRRAPDAFLPGTEMATCVQRCNTGRLHANPEHARRQHADDQLDRSIHQFDWKDLPPYLAGQ
jgi:hypothetical protein